MSLFVAGAGAAAIADQQPARGDMHALDSSHVLPGAERYGRAGTRNADRSRRSAALPRAPVRRARYAVRGISRSSGAIRSARKLGAGNARAPSPKPPGPFGPASSPFSAIDLLQGLDRHFPLGNHALELRVLGLELPQSLHIGGVKLAEAPPPDVDRLLADLVLLGHLRDGT